MDFIQLLKDKAFKRYSLHVIRDEKTQQYKIVQYNDNIDEEFFRDLSFDLSLPRDQKNFTFGFIRNDFKGFKNISVQAVIKQNPSIEQFDNLFHSFYKNIPINDLMNAVYIKADYLGNVAKNSVYQPYILYFLKQNFNHQNLYPADLINTLNFNFHVNENTYPELKESLYTFLSNHAFEVKNKIRNGYTRAEHIDSTLKDFENHIYNKISTFIKPDDMKLFNEFWPRILIASNNDNMITSVNNTFVFDLSHSYLSDSYSQITNEAIAHKTSDFIAHTINNNLDDYMHASIINQNSVSSRFVLVFKKPLNKQHIPDIFDNIIELQIKTNQFKENYLKVELRSVFDQGVEAIKKQIDYFQISDKLPGKNIKEIKKKI